MFISNNCTSFHLWWKENLVKHRKVSKCYETDCSYDICSVPKYHSMFKGLWLSKLLWNCFASINSNLESLSNYFRFVALTTWRVTFQWCIIIELIPIYQLMLNFHYFLLTIGAIIVTSTKINKLKIKAILCCKSHAFISNTEKIENMQILIFQMLSTS